MIDEGEYKKKIIKALNDCMDQENRRLIEIASEKIWLDDND